MLAPRWRKVLRDLWDNKSRTVLVIISIAVGVVAFGGLFMTQVIAVRDLNAQFKSISPSQISISTAPFDDYFVQWIEQQDDVERAEGEAIHRVKAYDSDGESFTLALHAYDADDFLTRTINTYRNVSADPFPPDRNQIILERSSLALTGMEVGDDITIELVNGKQYELTIIGTLHDVNAPPGGVFPQPTSYVTTRTLDYIGLPAQYNTINIRVDEDAIAGGQRPATLKELNVVADDIQRELQRREVPVGSVSVRRSDQHLMSNTLSGFTTILTTVGLFSMLLSAFLVVNTISGLMAQQKRQIGVMKIIGASRPQIFMVYMVMVICLGVLALIIALPSSLLLAAALLDFIAVQIMNIDVLDLSIPPDVLVMQIAVGLLVPMLAALGPVMSGTRMTAAEAVSDHVVSSSASLIDRALALIRGLPRPTLISIRNTFRRKSRLAMTLITLTVAGALFITIVNVQAGMMQFLDNALSFSGFDVQISLLEPTETAGITRRIEQVEGVRDAEGWASTLAQRIRPDDTRSASMPILGVRHDSAFISPTMEDGVWLSERDEYNRYDIIVNTEFLRDEPDGVELGDIITMERGDQEEDWRIVGVIAAGQEPLAYAHYDSVNEFNGTPDQTTILQIATLERTAEYQLATTARIETYLDERDIAITRTITRSEIVEEATGQLNVLVTMLLIVAVMVAAVGGLGLAGTMSLNVLERTREIGVMRAVGAGNGAIRLLFVGEGVIIGLLSALIALPLAVPGTLGFGQLLGTVVFTVPLPFILTFNGPLLWIGIITAISVVASVMPAQRASQISIREALAYE